MRSFAKRIVDLVKQEVSKEEMEKAKQEMLSEVGLFILRCHILIHFLRCHIRACFGIHFDMKFHLPSNSFRRLTTLTKHCNLFGPRSLSQQWLKRAVTFILSCKILLEDVWLRTLDL